MIQLRVYMKYLLLRKIKCNIIVTNGIDINKMDKQKFFLTNVQDKYGSSQHLKLMKCIIFSPFKSNIRTKIIEMVKHNYYSVTLICGNSANQDDFR